MSKLRSVSTSFWSDPFVEDLTPNQKLLFLYLITNDKTNMLGIYELSIKKISFETGIKKEDVLKGFKAFERLEKVKYIENYVILLNYMKHQNFNTNMKKSAVDIYNSLPKVLKIKGLIIDRNNPSKGFESLQKGYLILSKREEEVEREEETKEEVKIETKEGVVFPFDSDLFFTTWISWRNYKKVEHRFNYKSIESEQAALMELNNLAEGIEAVAIQMIKKSMAQGWKGFFKLDENGGTGKNKSTDLNINSKETQDWLAGKP